MSEEARKSEAADETTATLTFRGVEFTVPRDYDDLSVDFLEALEEGKTVGIIRGALGDQQWAIVKRMGLKIRDLADLSEKVAAAMGFGDTGESQASSA